MRYARVVCVFMMLSVVSVFAVREDISESTGISEGAVISEQMNETLNALFDILFSIYDKDISLIPREPNDILALEYSDDARDQVAWRFSI